jgi:hypothetical protein
MYDQHSYVYYVVMGERRRRSRPTPEKALGNVPVPELLWLMIMLCWRHTASKRLTMQQVLFSLDADHKKFSPLENVLFTISARTKCWLTANHLSSIDM